MISAPFISSVDWFVAHQEHLVQEMKFFVILIYHKKVLDYEWLPIKVGTTYDLLPYLSHDKSLKLHINFEIKRILIIPALNPHPGEMCWIFLASFKLYTIGHDLCHV